MVNIVTGNLNFPPVLRSCRSEILGNDRLSYPDGLPSGDGFIHKRAFMCFQLESEFMIPFGWPSLAAISHPHFQSSEQLNHLQEISHQHLKETEVPPMLWIPHQLVGSPLGRNVTLECFTEAHPNSLNYWTREDGQMIHDTKKYHIQSKPLEVPYKVQMMLTIVGLRAEDFGTYKCVAKNPRGETDGTIRLYASALMTTTPVPVTEEPVKQDTPIELDTEEKLLDNNLKARKDAGGMGVGLDSRVKQENKDEERGETTETRADNGATGVRETFLKHIFFYIVAKLITSVFQISDMAHT